MCDAENSILRVIVTMPSLGTPTSRLALLIFYRTNHSTLNLGA
jgi:hypothetical protein